MPEEFTARSPSNKRAFFFFFVSFTYEKLVFLIPPSFFLSSFEPEFFLQNIMDVVSRDIEKAEIDADRGHDSITQTHAEPTTVQHARTRSHSSSPSSSSSVSSSDNSSRSGNLGVSTTVSRTYTQRDLERHPTALSRIATQRSQHGATVGALHSRASQGTLPAFGAGKPYPPLLPDKEEYVVEFDGPEDSSHPHNWPFKKK